MATILKPERSFNQPGESQYMKHADQVNRFCNIQMGKMPNLSDFESDLIVVARDAGPSISETFKHQDFCALLFLRVNLMVSDAMNRFDSHHPVKLVL